MLWAAIVASGIVGVPGPADLVIVDGRIWSDGRVDFARFAAVRDGRFTYVGPAPSPDELEAWVGPGTEVVDAQGRVVLPGLIDSHIHMLSGGLQSMQLYLRDAGSRGEFVEMIEAWCRGLEPGAWIQGGRWSTESWPDATQPTRAWVDPVSGDHPLLLSRMDGHSALANSRALALAGITRDGPPDPEGGVIDRDPGTGEPTGLLRDSAVDLVARHVPAPTTDGKVEALRRAATLALREGITAVCDIPDFADLAAYERLAGEGDTGVRFFLYPTAGSWAEADAALRRFAGLEGWVEVRGLKGYLDGSLGSRTAYMRAPFHDSHGHESVRGEWRGLLREGVEDGRLKRNLDVAAGRGWQSILHAIGDEANHLLLDMLEDAYGDRLRAARCRAEHAQHLLPDDVRRFAELGVVASMQPFHKADDGRYAEAYLGSARCESSYAWRSLLDAGAVVVFGSDWPVVTQNPFLGIEAAVTGRTLDGRIWQTQQNLTVGEALRCYTSRAAWAARAENDLGRIAPGCRADFVVLERSPFDEQVVWERLRPLAVYVEGRPAFTRSRRPAPGPPGRPRRR